MDTLTGITSLDDLVSEVRAHLSVDVVMVTEIKGNLEIFHAVEGFAIPDALKDGAPLEYSVCHHTTAMDFPLVIDDTFSHPLVSKNRSVIEFNVAAYLGAPIHDARGQAVGAVCALNFHQRRWSDADIRYMIDAAAVADAFFR